MTTAIEVYRFPVTGAEVRSVLVNDEPWFVAADLGMALGYRDAYNATRFLTEVEKGTHLVSTPGGQQEVTVVSEAGLYRMVMRSNQPNAVKFQMWIANDVLPAIRRTGKYEVAQAPALPTSYADALRELAATVEERDAAAAALAAATPAAEAWNHLASANGDFSVADAAKILSRDPLITIGRDRLFTLMARWQWVYRPGGFDRYRVYQAQVETGRLSELPSSHYHPRTGELVLDPPQVRVTAKGLQEIRTRLLKEKSVKSYPDPDGTVPTQPSKPVPPK
ncbi:MAG: phage antirepressor protein [Saccharothrix sp.]|nr:phage antirepressor protein [Saccharothrix sp.]